VTAACGNLAIPSTVGLSVWPALQLTVQTSSASFGGRAQAGLYSVSFLYSSTAIVVNTTAGAAFAASGSLVVYGGWGTGGATSDVYYSSNAGQGWAVVQQSTGTNSALRSQAGGVATCSDMYQQILYLVGGGVSDSTGVSSVFRSPDLGQRWSNNSAPFPGRFNALCLVDSSSRLYVIAGKLANTSGIYSPGVNGSEYGDDIANDVWLGSWAGSSFQWQQQTASAAFPARDGPAGATYYSATFTTDLLYVVSGYMYNSQIAQLSGNDNGIGSNDGQPSTVPCI
jgi:hypothetical protein